MDSCIGCHSCEVACAEQNGNPVGVNWRTVGEVEGGTFPDTRRFSISMACNHCLEPECLTGCPTNAYIKLSNGVVQHHADDCIGCRYCMWNCPYDVPVFNSTRRIVTKCDLCQPRLSVGMNPACVEACPTHAINVEKVDVAAWRREHAAADAPGLPPSDITISTTRIVVSERMPAQLVVADHHRVEPEDPHWPLVFLTLLSQIALGAVAATAVIHSISAITDVDHAVTTGALSRSAWVGFVISALALGASIFHLGRPAHAWKAMRNLRTSWLSREVALLGAFSGTALLYALAQAVSAPAISVVVPAGLLATALGAAGVFASGRLYLIRARPMWNSPRTIVGFFASALTMGPLVVVLAFDPAIDPAWWNRALLPAAAAGLALQSGVTRHLLRTASGNPAREFRGAAILLQGRFVAIRQARAALTTVAVVGLLTASISKGEEIAVFAAGAFVCALAADVIGRHLFYATVVPMRPPGRFFGHDR